MDHFETIYQLTEIYKENSC